MKKIINLVMLFSLVFILSSGAVNAKSVKQYNEDIFEITTETSERLKITKIKISKNYKNNRRISNYDYSKVEELFDLESWELRDSNEIIIQDQIVLGNFVFDQEDQVKSNISNITASSIADPGSYDDPEGYVWIRTIVRDTGYNSFGDKSYEADVIVAYAGSYGDSYQPPTFWTRGEDRIVIGHGAGAYFNSEEASRVDGYYQFYEYTPSQGQWLTTWGVTQGFVGQSDFLDTKINLANRLNVNNNFYGDFVSYARYPFALTSNTTLYASYIHNERLFGGKLTLSVGAYGFSISINGSHTEYSITPIALSA